jgi:chromosome segregation ATPase
MQKQQQRRLMRRLQQRQHNVHKLAQRLRRMQAEETEAKVRAFNMRMQMLQTRKREVSAQLRATKQELAAICAKDGDPLKDAIHELRENIHGHLCNILECMVSFKEAKYVLHLFTHNFASHYGKYKAVLKKGEIVMAQLHEHTQRLKN